MSEEEKIPHRLVRISHFRCGDYDGTTYVAAPLDWTDDEIDDKAEAAKEAYLADFEKARNFPDEPPDPGWRLEYDKVADKTRTIANVEAEYQALKRAHDAWLNERATLSKRFEDYLLKEGFLSLWGDEATESFDLYWGHNHGKAYQYGDDGDFADKSVSPFVRVHGEPPDPHRTRIVKTVEYEDD